MPGKNAEKINTELKAAQDEEASRTIDDPIEVLVTLDNGEKYKGMAYEVRPDGLVMIDTGNCDLGVRMANLKVK